MVLGLALEEQLEITNKYFKRIIDNRYEDDKIYALLGGFKLEIMIAVKKGKV